MLQTKINNQLGFFIPGKKNKDSVKKKDSESLFPLQTKTENYNDPNNYPDSIFNFNFSKNQSLRPDQIEKSRTEKISEKIQFLHSIYQISNFQEVKNFLLRNRFLIPLTEEIPDKIHEYYGSEQKIALEILHEPDFLQSSKLWAIVLTSKNAEEARSIMDKIDEDWWLENIDRTNCKLNIGIDYV